MKSRLNIDGTDVAFVSELPISTNRSVKDIREPDKTQSSFSKTISIPGTKEVIKIFENCFELNISTQNFNANLKTPAEYFVNEVRVFNGSLQLLKIRNTFSDTAGNYLPDVFECAIFGETGNLFLALAGLYLTDLDLSDLDHTFDVTFPLSSDPKFDASNLGEGYKYPFIDYGLSGSPVINTFNFAHLKPAVFEVEYVRRIFEDAGYTWAAGSYFDSAYAKNILTPCVNEGPLRKGPVTIALNSFRAAPSSDDNYNLSGNAPTGSSIAWDYGPTSVTPVMFDDDSTGDLFDNNNMINAPTAIVTIVDDDNYDLVAKIVAKITVTPPATTTNFDGTIWVETRIEVFPNGGSAWGLAGSSTEALNVGDNFNNLVNPQTFTIGATALNIPCVAGDAFRVVVSIINNSNFTSSSIVFKNGATPITSGSSSLDFEIQGGAAPIESEFYAVIVGGALPYGGTVEMNETIPQNVTQLDFITSIIKCENLYCEPQLDNPTVYEIHSREDFYNDISTALDWEQKLDVSREQEVIPLGELSAKRYVYSYKPDQDHYNKLYHDEFKEPYGTHIEDIGNDFIKDEKKIEVIFSPTPIAQTTGKFGLCPRFWKFNDQGNTQSLALNIRRVYFNVISGVASGLIVNGFYKFKIGVPYCGDVDDPYSSTPTVDLNFGIPKRLYWYFAGAKYTDNNRYNERYSKYITEISHRDSKVVVEHFYLDEFDINTFSFRDLVYAYGAYHQVNRIIDYDPQRTKTTKVELLKLIAGEAFAPTVIDPGFYDPSSGSGTASRTYNGGGSWGNNNQNGGTASLISGHNNMIGEGTDKISLVGCERTKVSGPVSNFHGFALIDEEITEENSDTFKSGVLVDAPIKNRRITITSSDSTVFAYREYFCDTTGGNLDLTLDDTGQEYTVVKTVAGNTVNLIAGSGTVYGLTALTAIGIYKAVFDGTDWFVS